jgi:hypothetical protein
MKRSIVRDNNGTLLLLLESEVGESKEACRNAFYGVFRHYTQYGYTYLMQVIPMRMNGREVLRIVFGFDKDTLALKMQEDGFYKWVEYKEAENYIEL